MENKLGERLKERREELMMTQKDIADNIGVAVSTIQRYESGKIKDIKLPVIDAIAKFLRVQPEWLMGYEEPEYAEPYSATDLQSKSAEIDNREIFSKNLRFLMNQKNKSRKQVCSDLGIKYSTFSEWLHGKKYPRIDKMEMLAQYFGVTKSDLIEKRNISNGEIEIEDPSPAEITSLSRTLKRKRKEFGLTLAQIADIMEVSEATVQRWESGNIKSVRYDKIDKLAKLLHVNSSEIIGMCKAKERIDSAKIHQKYVVLQVTLKESAVEYEVKRLVDLEAVINNQVAKGYRLHSMSTATFGSKDLGGKDKIQATLVFEKL